MQWQLYLHHQAMLSGRTVHPKTTQEQSSTHQPSQCSHSRGPTAKKLQKGSRAILKTALLSVWSQKVKAQADGSTSSSCPDCYLMAQSTTALLESTAENLRAVGVGRDLWSSPSPSPQQFPTAAAYTVQVGTNISREGESSCLWEAVPP